MENNVNNALNSFIGDEKKVKNEDIKQAKKVFLDEREGLIERVDKVFVTKEGKQLLREQY